MADNNKRSVGTKQSPEYIKKLIVNEASRRGVPVELALAVAQQESGFNNIAVSKPNTDGSRDHGVFQLNDRYHKLRNVYDPVENIQYGIGMLKDGLDRNNGNIAKTLSDYNAGPNATGKGRQQGDAYALKVMRLANAIKPTDIRNINQSSPQAVASIQPNVTGAASPVDNIGETMANLQQAGVQLGEEIYNKYVAPMQYDPALYEEIRDRKVKEVQDAQNAMLNTPTRTSAEEKAAIEQRFQNARNDLINYNNLGAQIIADSMGANQVNPYYEKLLQEDARRLAEQRAANPYTQMAQVAPLDLQNYARTQAFSNAQQNLARGLAASGKVPYMPPNDFATQRMAQAQAAQAEQLATQTGLTPEQFIQRGTIDYNTMGTAYNNQQQALMQLIGAAQQGDRQAQQLLANIYTTMGTNLGNAATAEQNAIRQADLDALERAKFNADIRKFGVQQGQNLDYIPATGDINYQASKLGQGVNAVTTGAQLGTNAANQYGNMMQRLEAADAKATGKVVDPYDVYMNQQKQQLNAISMNPNVTPDMLQNYVKQQQEATMMKYPETIPFYTGNYSQYIPVPQQNQQK